MCPNVHGFLAALQAALCVLSSLLPWGDKPWKHHNCNAPSSQAAKEHCDDKTEEAKGAAPAEPPASNVFAEASPGGTEGPGGGFNPQMMGDFLTYGGSAGAVVQSRVSVGNNPPFATVTDRFSLRVPDLAKGPYKIAENESPAAQDRVFLNYNYFRVPSRPGASTSSLTTDVPVQVVGSNAPGSNGPFPLRSTLNGTLNGIPTDPLTTFTNLNNQHTNVNRETFGFETTLLGGDASFGMRIPYVQSGNIVRPPASTSSTTFVPGANTTFSVLDTSDSFDGADVEDISLIFKYQFINNRQTGSVLSGGLVLTTPTGKAIPLADGSIVHPWIAQPFVGFRRYLGNDLFIHGFSSFTLPTDWRDPLLFFNDIGVGYHVYQCNANQFLTGFVPTVEVHINTPLDQQGSFHQPVGTPYQVDLTAGAIIDFYHRASLAIGVSFPITGPEPYTGEGLAQLNWRF